ncbi:hypothetical protein MCG45_07330 [Clostridium perfringens]|uniref:hypothetical protein n=1 Tax=Clostridium perfringens TaxID=1502 RepID=UPI001F070162|nr:hypothetical protein [Clostridium perfringens]MCH1962687.1 hypothetical protein [Clostridium perfringens]
MIKNLKEQFPSWTKDIEKNPLILSDDIDSLMSCIFLRDKFNCKVRYFYDSNSNKKEFTHLMYKQKGFDYKLQDRKAIAVDLALEGVRCFDNHVIKVRGTDKTNKLSANLNAIDNIYLDNYTEKWCVSTYITILSYYDIDISKWTREQLAILCAIDGVYYPFKNTRFKPIASKHLKQLDYEFLIKFIENNIDYIEQIKKELNLDEKIKVVEGKLTTDIKLDKLSEIFNIDISLPNATYQLKETLTKKIRQPASKENIRKYLIENKKLRNFVLVSKKTIIYSY